MDSTALFKAAYQNRASATKEPQVSVQAPKPEPRKFKPRQNGSTTHQPGSSPNKQVRDVPVSKPVLLTPEQALLFRQAFGSVVRDYRLAREWTLRELAGRSDISYGYLSEVERGEKEATSEVLACIARGLDMSLSDLLVVVAFRVADIQVPSQTSTVAPTPVSRNHRESERPMLFRQAFGAEVRDRRAMQGIGLREAAGRAGLSYGYLSEVERGLKEFTSEAIVDLTGALGGSVAEMLIAVAFRIFDSTVPSVTPPARAI